MKLSFYKYCRKITTARHPQLGSATWGVKQCPSLIINKVPVTQSDGKLRAEWVILLFEGPTLNLRIPSGRPEWVERLKAEGERQAAATRLLPEKRFQTLREAKLALERQAEPAPEASQLHEILGLGEINSKQAQLT